MIEFQLTSHSVWHLAPELGRYPIRDLDESLLRLERNGILVPLTLPRRIHAYTLAPRILKRYEIETRSMANTSLRAVSHAFAKLAMTLRGFPNCYPISKSQFCSKTGAVLTGFPDAFLSHRHCDYFVFLHVDSDIAVPATRVAFKFQKRLIRIAGNSVLKRLYREDRLHIAIGAMTEKRANAIARLALCPISMRKVVVSKILVPEFRWITPGAGRVSIDFL